MPKNYPVIEIEVDGKTVTGHFKFVSSSDYCVALDANPNIRETIHVPAFARPYTRLLNDDGSVSEKCLDSAKGWIRSMWLKHSFITEHKDEIDSIVKAHKKQNEQRKAEDEEILKTSTKKLQRMFEAGVITKAEHTLALQKRRQASTDLYSINSELANKLTELAQSYYPECDYFRGFCGNVE